MLSNNTKKHQSTLMMEKEVFKYYKFHIIFLLCLPFKLSFTLFNQMISNCQKTMNSYETKIMTNSKVMPFRYELIPREHLQSILHGSPSASLGSSQRVAASIVAQPIATIIFQRHKRSKTIRTSKTTAAEGLNRPISNGYWSRRVEYNDGG